MSSRAFGTFPGGVSTGATPDSSVLNPAPMGARAPGSLPPGNGFLPGSLFDPLYRWGTFVQAGGTQAGNVGTASAFDGAPAAGFGAPSVDSAPASGIASGIPGAGDPAAGTGGLLSSLGARRDPADTAGGGLLSRLAMINQPDPSIYSPPPIPSPRLANVTGLMPWWLQFPPG